MLWHLGALLILERWPLPEQANSPEIVQSLPGLEGKKERREERKEKRKIHRGNEESGQPTIAIAYICHTVALLNTISAQFCGAGPPKVMHCQAVVGPHAVL